VHYAHPRLPARTPACALTGPYAGAPKRVRRHAAHAEMGFGRRCHDEQKRCMLPLYEAVPTRAACRVLCPCKPGAAAGQPPVGHTVKTSMACRCFPAGPLRAPPLATSGPAWRLPATMSRSRFSVSCAARGARSGGSGALAGACTRSARAAVLLSLGTRGEVHAEHVAWPRPSL